VTTHPQLAPHSSIADLLRASKSFEESQLNSSSLSLIRQQSQQRSSGERSISNKNSPSTTGDKKELNNRPSSAPSVDKKTKQNNRTSSSSNLKDIDKKEENMVTPVPVKPNLLRYKSKSTGSFSDFDAAYFSSTREQAPQFEHEPKQLKDHAIPAHITITTTAGGIGVGDVGLLAPIARTTLRVQEVNTPERFNLVANPEEVKPYTVNHSTTQQVQEQQKHHDPAAMASSDLLSALPKQTPQRTKHHRSWNSQPHTVSGNPFEDPAILGDLTRQNNPTKHTRHQSITTAPIGTLQTNPTKHTRHQSITTAPIIAQQTNPTKHTRHQSITAAPLSAQQTNPTKHTRHQSITAAPLSALSQQQQQITTPTPIAFQTSLNQQHQNHPLQQQQKHGGELPRMAPLLKRGVTTGSVNSNNNKNTTNSHLLAFDPLLNFGGTATSTSTTQLQKTIQTQHLSLDKSQLSQIAAELSKHKPRVNTEEEEKQLAQENHRITLGDLPESGAKGLQSCKSLGPEDWDGIINEINDLGGGVGVERGINRKTLHRRATSEFSVRNVFGIGNNNNAKDRSDRDGGNESTKNFKNVSPLRFKNVKGQSNVTHAKDTSDINEKDAVSKLERNFGSKSKSERTLGGRDDQTLGQRKISPNRRSVRNIFGGRGGGGPSPISTSQTNLQKDNTEHKQLEITGGTSSADTTNQNIAAPTTAVQSSNNTEIKIRSSEQDPTPHQMGIPTQSDVLLPAKLCHLLDQYRKIDQSFDFSTLIGMARDSMESFVFTESKSRSKSPTKKDLSVANKTLSSSVVAPPPLNNHEQSEKALPSLLNCVMQIAPSAPKTTRKHRPVQLLESHKPIVSKFLECKDDVIVEGFYHEVGGSSSALAESSRKVNASQLSKDKPSMNRMEVAIFQSDYKRKFLVVYQGSAESQAKPVQKKEQKRGDNNPRGNAVEFAKGGHYKFSNDQPVSVFPPFRRAYFPTECDLETKVFAKLDELAEKHPFFDVIMTGHSFGGMLALLASMRYACSRPMLMVSCVAFGCPKVGALNFRHYVNSLPNLKVIRVENGSDPWIHTPDNPMWVHAGHNVVISSNVSKGGKNNVAGDEVSSNKSDKNLLASQPQVKAYKFGDRPLSPSDKSVNKFMGALRSRQGNRQERLRPGSRQERQQDHDISSYVKAIERTTTMGVQWPIHFVGEGGTGVSGLNQEKRLVV